MASNVIIYIIASIWITVFISERIRFQMLKRKIREQQGIPKPKRSWRFEGFGK